MEIKSVYNYKRCLMCWYARDSFLRDTIVLLSSNAAKCFSLCFWDPIVVISRRKVSSYTITGRIKYVQKWLLWNCIWSFMRRSVISWHNFIVLRTCICCRLNRFLNKTKNINSLAYFELQRCNRMKRWLCLQRETKMFWPRVLDLLHQQLVAIFVRKVIYHTFVTRFTCF